MSALLGLCVAMLLLSSPGARADPMRECEQPHDPARAIRACSRLISAIPGSGMLHNTRGVAYFRNGETDRAIADYTQAIRLDPESMEPCYNGGQALSSTDAYSLAIPDFDELIARNPRGALGRNGRAWALFKLGKMGSALEDANHAIAADAGYAAAYDTRGHICEALGRREEAITDLRRALMLDPRNPLAHVTREALSRLGVTP